MCVIFVFGVFGVCGCVVFGVSVDRDSLAFSQIDHLRPSTCEEKS